MNYSDLMVQNISTGISPIFYKPNLSLVNPAIEAQSINSLLDFTLLILIISFIDSTQKLKTNNKHGPWVSVGQT